MQWASAKRRRSVLLARYPQYLPRHATTLFVLDMVPTILLFVGVGWNLSAAVSSFLAVSLLCSSRFRLLLSYSVAWCGVNWVALYPDGKLSTI